LRRPRARRPACGAGRTARGVRARPDPPPAAARCERADRAAAEVDGPRARFSHGRGAARAAEPRARADRAAARHAGPRLPDDRRRGRPAHPRAGRHGRRRGGCRRRRRVACGGHRCPLRSRGGGQAARPARGPRGGGRMSAPGVHANASPLKRALAAIEKLQARVEELEGARREPIAIVGLSCRFPGGADSPEAFWRLLQEGVDAVAEIPPDRWDADAYYDPDPDAAGKMATRWGAFLPRVDTFDPRLFGITP